MDDSNEDSPSPDFSSTVPLIRSEGGTAPLQSPKSSQSAAPPPTSPKPARRGIPTWIWLVGAGAIVVVLAVTAALAWFLLRQPGFIMIVRGAPPASDVFVDNISRGATSSDGSIRVPGLKAGKRVVRVSHDGYIDFNTTVTGQDGDNKIVVAQLVASNSQPSLPNEIDYHGPMMLVAAGEFVMGDDISQCGRKAGPQTNAAGFLHRQVRSHKRSIQEVLRRNEASPSHQPLVGQ